MTYLKSMVDHGAMQIKEHVLEGIERCPEALSGLFTGNNFGKQLVKL
jgi:NADPH-dependent curcumin reductase CurA